jgi:hypothetical protein
MGVGSERSNRFEKLRSVKFNLQNEPGHRTSTYPLVTPRSIAAALVHSILRQFVVLLIALSILCGGHLAESAAAQYDIGIIPAELPQHGDGDHNSRDGHVVAHSCHGTCHLLPSSLMRVAFHRQIDGKLTPTLRVSFRNRHPRTIIRPPIDLCNQPHFG